MWLQVVNERGAENTIIDCAGASYGFHIREGESLDSVIGGFTVTNCAVSAFLVEDSSPTIYSCIARNNPSNSSGAGFYLSRSGSEVRDCASINNTAVDGAGICKFTTYIPVLDWSSLTDCL